MTFKEFYYQESEKQEPNNKEDVQDDIEKPKPFTFADFKEAKSENDTEKLSKLQKSDSIENDDVNYDDSPTKDDPKKVIRYSDVSPEKVKTTSDAEVDKGRTVNITINDAPISEKNKNIEVILPPQPVPPEIEQQRAMSISKDMEVQRNCFLNVLMAYLELVLSFPLERFHLIYPVLQTGFVQLARTVNDPQLLDRINVFFDKKDLVG